MKEITLKNYRCFRDEQSVRLAPLTLLVGDNGTGKTSFLALIRVLSQLASGIREPNFNMTPFDLGSFDDIAHYRGPRGGRAKTFEAGFSARQIENGRKKESTDESRLIDVYVEFAKQGPAPVFKRIRISRSDELYLEIQGIEGVTNRFGTPNGEWELVLPSENLKDVPSTFLELTLWLNNAKYAVENNRGDLGLKSLKGKNLPAIEDLDAIEALVRYFRTRERRYGKSIFSSAPIRSKPRRTYDPRRPFEDAKGDYVPMYLADMYVRNKRVWQSLEYSLTDFGKESGLFDEIIVKPLGSRVGAPFQIQIRKFGKRLKGPPRNLIDVGYGVSQVLPTVIELLRPDAPPIFLLQQPEVHLHPSAQAALGSLFCQIANDSRQLIVETHSDYILDRARMAVRDKASNLKPEDVSVLYFERRNLGVKLHSLRFDQEGNVLGAPKGYRQFFLDEIRKSLGL